MENPLGIGRKVWSHSAHSRKSETDITHVYREANQLADSTVNETFNHSGKLQYHNFAQSPTVAKKILNLDKTQVPSFRISTRPIFRGST